MTFLAKTKATSDWGGRIAIAFRCLGWLVVTTLCALGILALIAFAIGSFTLDGTILQINNLTSRFVVAGVIRQAQFDHVLVAAFAVCFAAVSILRRTSMIDAIFSEKGFSQ
jgi:hypothetical protein